MIFGFNIPMWGYRFGYTAAQIELAAADAPFVSYHHDEDKKEKFKKADSLAILQAQKKWEDRNDGKPKHFDFGSKEQHKQ